MWRGFLTAHFKDWRTPMFRTNVKKWATSTVAALWPHLFRWTHWPIVVRRRSSGSRPVLLGRDMYLESRESPTTIWRLDPIVAAAISSGLMGQLIQQLSADRRSLDTGRLSSQASGHVSRANGSCEKASHPFAGTQTS